MPEGQTTAEVTFKFWILDDAADMAICEVALIAALGSEYSAKVSTYWAEDNVVSNLEVNVGRSTVLQAALDSVVVLTGTLAEVITHDEFFTRYSQHARDLI